MTSTLIRKAALSVASVALAGALVPGVTVPVAVAQPVDPALEQTVTDSEAIVHGDKVAITAGHVDMGPILDDGELRLFIRDDATGAPAWRDPADVVFGVSDAAALTVPEQDGYEFMGADAGDKVWVVPQTEVADVPWVGWNTQSPTVDDLITKGVKLEFVSHDGPGEHSVFLQPGGFAEPDVLWTEKDGGFAWVEPDQHVHANWVFTEPGSHAVTMRLTAEQPDGSTLSSDATLRFAVGIDPTEYTTPAKSAGKKGSDEGLPVGWLVGGGVLVAVLVVGGVFLVLRKK